MIKLLNDINTLFSGLLKTPKETCLKYRQVLYTKLKGGSTMRTRDVSSFYFPEKLKDLSPLFFHAYQDGAHKEREDYPKEVKVYFKEDNSYLHTISISEREEDIKITDTAKDQFPKYINEQLVDFFKVNRMVLLDFWKDLWLDSEEVEDSIEAGVYGKSKLT